MIDSTKQALSYNSTITTSGITSSSSTDVKEQYDGTIHESDLLSLPSIHDHKHRIQEDVVEHRPEETSLSAGGEDSGITQADILAYYYTEGLKNPGWLTVLAAFMLNFYTFGIVCSWGVFQVLYLEVYAEKTDEALLSLVGTSAFGPMYALGLVGTPIIQRLNYRSTIFLGAVICCPLSQILASFATEVWQIALCSLMFGFGTGLCYTASSTLPSQWFEKRRGFASGIASSGTCIGPMVFSPLAQSLITNLGYRNALRVLAAIGFATCCLGVILIRPRNSKPPAQSKGEKRPSKWWQRNLSLDQSMFTWEYNLFLLHSFLVTFAYPIPFLLAQTYASELGADPAFASIFLSVLEAGNGLSRIIFGWLGDQWLGRINVLFLTTFISGTGIFTSVIWQNAISIHIFVLYCVAFGFTGGVAGGLQPVISAEIVGVDRIQEGAGVSYFVSFFGHLAGAPIAGSLHLHYGWTAAIQFTGAMAIASSIAVLGTRFLFNKRLLAKV